jgi:hypothetical protein
VRRGLAVFTIILAGCVTAKDAVGGGDARLDEAGRPDAPEVRNSAASCGAEGKGDLVILDGRTGGPLGCLAVTITAEPMSCPASSECPTTTLFRGLTNRAGQALSSGAFSSSRLVAVADGFAPAVLPNVSTKPGTLYELELMPTEGYWLKVLDPEGNYLHDVSLTFRQGDGVIAQLRTNVLANVVFAQRQPFSGQPVTVEAEGFQPVVIADVTELGEDGHTLVLRR